MERSEKHVFPPKGLHSWLRKPGYPHDRCSSSIKNTFTHIPEFFCDQEISQTTSLKNQSCSATHFLPNKIFQYPKKSCEQITDSPNICTTKATCEVHKINTHCISQNSNSQMSQNISSNFHQISSVFSDISSREIGKLSQQTMPNRFCLQPSTCTKHKHNKTNKTHHFSLFSALLLQKWTTNTLQTTPLRSSILRNNRGTYLHIKTTDNKHLQMQIHRILSQEAPRSPQPAGIDNVAGEQNLIPPQVCTPTYHTLHHPTPLPALTGQAELVSVVPARRAREESPDGRGLRAEYRFLTSMSLRDNAAAILGDMSSRHYFVDLDQEPYTYNEEYKAATQLAIGQLYRVKLDAEKKTVLTNLKESEAIRGGLTVISNTIRLQINSLERPLLGSAVTGPAARDSVGRLSSALDTANRLRFVAESYHSIRITKFRALDRKLAATKAYISAAQIYLQRAERPLGPYQTFTPPQALPEGVFTGTAFIAADFRELEYHHLQAVVDKYDQTVPATPHFKSPEDLAICHRCRGPPGHRDHLYQTEPARVVARRRSVRAAAPGAVRRG